MTITQTYYTVEKLIHRTTYYYSKKLKVNYEDLFCLAQEVFMKAQKAWKQNRTANFKTYLNNALRRTFSRLPRAIRPLHCPDHDFNTITTRERFDFNSLLENVSQDAKEMMKLAINPPLEVQWLSGRQHNPNQVRNALKQFLRNLGWSNRRIFQSFTEIQNALYDTIL